MKILKKLIKIVTGQSNPMQLFLAVLFGGMIGFLPGFSYAPLLYIIVIGLLILLNVNLVVAAIIYAVARLLSFTLEVVSYHVGVFVLDGFLQGILKWMINTPVFAYAGFDYYLVTGSFVLALILGLIFGYLITKLVSLVKAKMAIMQTEETLYDNIVNKRLIKMISWIIFGQSVHKIDWVKLRNRRLKHPFRILGVIIIAVVIVFIFVLSGLLQSQMLKNILVSELTRINGATVEIDTFKLDMFNGKLNITGLEIADPKDLNQNRFYAKTLTMQVNVSELLTKRLTLSNVVINDVLTNQPRTIKAMLYLPNIDTSIIPTPKEDKVVQQAQTQHIKDFDVKYYVQNVQQYQSYLKQLKCLLGWLVPDTAKHESADVKQQEAKVTQMYHYADRQATDLITNTPTLTITKLTVNNINYSNNLIFNAIASNVSTQPWLIKAPTAIRIVSKDQTIKAKLISANHSKIANMFSLELKDMPADKLLQDIKFSKGFGLSAKTYSLEAQGKWQWQGDEIILDLPVNLIFQNANLSISDANKMIDRLPISIKLMGSLNNPVVQIDQSQVQSTLIKASTSEIKSRLKDELNNRLPFAL
ncbi:DUF2062 domain-containing protein [Fastidiosibacter lacustris]|uniref:DUF2062 domain-containing protein n=1 Tax=Fastidiosibacter lacustris TaxID=2056695 RepID=UPI000E34CFDF|nr:DUF2062 domain-containing protein [Fastidiosibacter lacustris]